MHYILFTSIKLHVAVYLIFRNNQYQPDELNNTRLQDFYLMSVNNVHGLNEHEVQGISNKEQRFQISAALSSQTPFCFVITDEPFITQIITFIKSLLVDIELFIKFENRCIQKSY